MRLTKGLLLAMVLAVPCATGQTSTLYKHVDKDGKVTYSDKPPPKDQEIRKDGTVSKKLDIDNQRNIIKSPPKPSDNAEENRPSGRRQTDMSQREKNLAEAREAYQQAKQALDEGKTPLDDEWRTIIGAGGKPARVPGEAFHERVKRLEEQLSQAAIRLKDAEKAMRE